MTNLPTASTLRCGLLLLLLLPLPLL